MCGGAEDPDSAGGVLDDGEDVQARARPGGGDLDAQDCEFAVDSAVPPGWVLAGQAQDRSAAVWTVSGRPRRLGRPMAAWRLLIRSRCQRQDRVRLEEQQEAAQLAHREPVEHAASTRDRWR